MRPSDRAPAAIELYSGPRLELLPLFTLADDSLAQINVYLESGEVLVARRAGQIIGHVQLIPAGFDWEIKSLAVVEQERGQGIGTTLVRAALDRASRPVQSALLSQRLVQTSGICVSINASDSGWTMSNGTPSPSIKAIRF
jgi:ribosomal protein S18 acetylase RimI-like enzyme